jgi:hypothetical protein
MVKKEDAPHTVTYNDKLTKFSLPIPITLESNAIVSKKKKSYSLQEILNVDSIKLDARLATWSL